MGSPDEGDDRTRLDEVFATYPSEAVIHFVAYAYGLSITDPGKYHRNNFVGTLTLLEAMRDHGVDKIVFSVSCAAYGNPGYCQFARRRRNNRSIPPARQQAERGRR